MKKYTSKSETELSHVIQGVLDLQEDTKVIFLFGELGAGKTTFVKSFVKQLGTTEEITSPTYSLVNEYRIDDTAIYHMDLYRLVSYEEALDIGIEEYLDSGDYCLIEWPQLIMDSCEAYISVSIDADSNGERTYTVELVKS